MNYKDAKKLVKQMDGDFYNGDRIDQFRAAQRINTITGALNVAVAVNVFQRKE